MIPFLKSLSYTNTLSCIKYMLYIIYFRKRLLDATVASMMEDLIVANAFHASTHLIIIGQLISSSTASVEWAFSLMNGLCTPQRNRLSQASRMRICLSSLDSLNLETVNQIIDFFKNKKNQGNSLVEEHYQDIWT